MKKALDRMAAKKERLANPAFSGMLEMFSDTKLDEPRPGGRFLLGRSAAALGIEDGHPESAGKPRGQKPYFSHSDDAERLAVEAARIHSRPVIDDPTQVAETRGGDSAFAHCPVGCNEALGQRQHEQDPVLGGVVQRSSRQTGHADPPLRGRLEVAVLRALAEALDQLEIRMPRKELPIHFAAPE